MPQNQRDKTVPTVAVVNDDATQLTFLAGLLNKAGIHTQAFDSARGALLAMDKKCLFDLIVTDLHMPEIDGWRFCRLLRSPEYEAFNRIPILVVSATFAGEEVSRITADLGANAFLASPVDSKRFIETAKSLLAGESTQDRLKILIVEDSRTQAALLKKAFVQQGYQVKIADTLGSAFSEFEKEIFDLAVIDYHLPDGNGDALLTRFKTIRPDAVCIMMTTDPEPELAVSWMRLGAAAYLRKPFDPEYLLELSSRTRKERSLLRIEDLVEKRTQELRESEEKYRGIFAAENDAIFLIDKETSVIMEVNNAACDLYGYTQDELLRLKNTDVSAEPEKTMQATAKTKRSIPLRYHKKKDGTIFPVDISASSLILAGREAILAAIRDITERKRSEEERERLISELTEALGQVKKLSGLLPICSFCKKIRDDKGYWNQIETYIRDHSEAEFSHGLCRECAKKHYPDFDL